ncbi:hypothetical protein BvCmsSINP059_03309 [Escherichia coli]|nr:hypothetical protein BvCmsSINP059_03309 [Escherichia coli]
MNDSTIFLMERLSDLSYWSILILRHVMQVH